MCRFCEQVAFGHDEPYDPQLGRGGFVPGANMPPDLILCDGPVITMNHGQPEATAIAIRAGVIQSVGGDELLARKGRGTRVVRLEGRAVLPGFVGSGARLPDRRDPASLDRWIEGRARAGFTAVDVTSLGTSWQDYQRLVQQIDRRHRLRLRGAAGEGLRRDWRDGSLVPGQGNDLMRIDTLDLRPSAATMAQALALHAEGWGVVFDCLCDSDLSAAVQLAALASGRSLSGMRVLSARPPEPAQADVLKAAGLAVVDVADTAPAAALTGARDTVLTRIAQVTRDAARVAGMAAIAGQIRPGYYADFVMLDRSPLSPGAAAPQVTGTWIEGVPVRPEADHVAA